MKLYYASLIMNDQLANPIKADRSLSGIHVERVVSLATREMSFIQFMRIGCSVLTIHPYEIKSFVMRISTDSWFNNIALVKLFANLLIYNIIVITV